MTMKKYYLAYGSNLNMEQMRRRCPNARPIGFATIDDYELLFKGSMTGSYLTIEKKKGSTVPAGVWEIDSEDEKALDRYEGFPRFYYKKELYVYLEEAFTGRERRIKALVYIMHEERRIGIPSVLYFQTCMMGYDDFGFDNAPLYTAYNECARRIGLTVGKRGGGKRK